MGHFFGFFRQARKLFFLTDSASTTSRLTENCWYLEEPTIADALLDRLFHRAYRIELKGTSLRKKGDDDLTKMKG